MKALRILKGVVLGVLFAVLLTFVTMQLWNWLVPVLFHGPVITFWQALGLFLLSKILLGGCFGRRGGFGGRETYWKNRMRRKMAGMSPEDQEAFKRKIRERWCHSGFSKPDESGDPSQNPA